MTAASTSDARKRRAEQAAASMPALKLFGQHDPTGGDGYIPGAWDQVMWAFTEGHITQEAYELLRTAYLPPRDVS